MLFILTDKNFVQHILHLILKERFRDDLAFKKFCASVWAVRDVNFGSGF